MAFQFPDPNVTPEFTGDNGITYSWDATDGKWVIKRYAADFDDRYVNEKGGDTMEGQLVINGPRKAGDDPDNPDLVSSVKVLNIDNAQNSSLQLRHGNNAKVYIGDTDVAIASDIKVVRAAGSIVKTDDADLMNIVGEEVSYTGKIENEKNLVTKKYVDDADEVLRQSIITIDEELESIAPSTERGQWAHEQASDPFRPPNSGKYFLIKGITAASDIGFAQFTEDYTEATGAVFSSTDNEGTSHTWSDVEADKLIDLLDKPDPDGLFGTITEIDTTTHSTGAAIVLWDTIQSVGSPTNNEPYLTNVKIFSAPTGGTASEFVLKSGDTMPGPNPLTFKTQKTSNNYNAPAPSTAYIKFLNDNNGSEQSGDIYWSGTSNTICTNSPFLARGAIYSSGGFIAYNGTKFYSPRMQLSDTLGKLQWGSVAKLTWQSDGIKEIIAKGSNGNKGQILKRDRTSTDSVEWSGVVDIGTSGSDRAVGELWYNQNDGTLYLRVS